MDSKNNVLLNHLFRYITVEFNWKNESWSSFNGDDLHGLYCEH